MTESGKLNFLEYSDEYLKSYLHEFVACNHVEAVKLAVKKGASVDTGNNSGVTPLHVAAENNNTLQCMKELLKSESVNVDSKTCYGDTPVAYSCQTNSDKILTVLIEHGADVNCGNFEKLTPLHIACRNDCLKTVMLLIKAGANVNAKDIRGWTPLHAAAKHAGVEVCEYLLLHRADANIPNNKDLLPLHFGAQGDTEVYNLIRNNTKSDSILKYCTFPGPNGADMINRSIVSRALESHNKALIERVLESDLPNYVLNCPVVGTQLCLLNDCFNETGELEPFIERFVLFTPLCFFLQFCRDMYYGSLEVLKLLLDKIFLTNTFKTCTNMYITGPIEVTFNLWCQQVDRFRIIRMLLKYGIDPDEECCGEPIKLFKICLIKLTDKSLIMFLLKMSNVVEPEDILRWIINDRNRQFIRHHNIRDVVYMLLVLSPYVTMSQSVYNYFMMLPCLSVEEENVQEKLKQVCEHPVRPLSSYCRSIIRRQLHYETSNNHRQFTEKLNSLFLPKPLISYLKFSEIKLINEWDENVDCQIVYDL